MTVGIYCRVSTEGQRDNTSIPEQRRLGQDFATKEGFTAHLYIDEAQSGADPTRENYQRLIEDIKSGKIDAVWTIADDRLARDVAESSIFRKLLEKTNTRLFIKDTEIDLSSIEVRFSQNVRSAVSEMERELIRARTLRGRKANVNSGGRKSHSIYGYDSSYNSEGKRILSVNPEEAKVVKKIYQLYQEGNSFKHIALLLNSEQIPTKWKGKLIQNRHTKQKEAANNTRWTQTNISNILRRPEYTGLVHDWKKENLLSAKYVPAILDAGVWEKVNESINPLAAKRNRNGIRQSIHPLSSLIKCQDCGAPYYFRPDGRNQPHYTHHNGSEKEASCINRPKYLKAKELEIVFEYCNSLVFKNPGETETFVKESLKAIEQRNRDSINSIEDLNKKASTIKKAINNLLDSIEITGATPDIKERLSRRRGELSLLENTIATLNAESESDKKSIEEISIAFNLNIGKKLLDATGPEKRRIYMSLIESATLKDKNLSILFRNSKRFEIILATRRNTVYSIDVHFRDKRQETVSFDAGQFVDKKRKRIVYPISIAKGKKPR